MHRSIVRPGLISCTDAAGDGRGDAGPKTAPKSDEDHEDWGDEPDGGEGVIAKACHPDGVGKVVDCLEKHGDHNGRGDLPDGFLRVSGEDGDAFGDHSLVVGRILVLVRGDRGFSHSASFKIRDPERARMKGDCALPECIRGCLDRSGLCCFLCR